MCSAQTSKLLPGSALVLTLLLHEFKVEKLSVEFV